MLSNKKSNCCGGWWRCFKGIEIFLRRIAFNLGNTPSKTEVKIISCIPIDVTDLQMKIADLERQLMGRGLRRPQSVNRHPSVMACNMYKTQRDHDREINVLPMNDHSYFPTSKRCTSENNIIYITDVYNDAHSGQEYKDSFDRMQRDKYRYKGTEPLVYCCNNVTTKFGQNYQSKNKKVQTVKKVKPVTIVHEQSLSDSLRNGKFISSSDVSEPVCRDNSKVTLNPYIMDAGMHSPTHGKDRNKTCYSKTHRCLKSCYYDDKYYDMIPVKDSSGGLKINEANKNEQLCSKARDSFVDPELRSYVINYQTATENRTSKKESVLRKMAKKRDTFPRYPTREDNANSSTDSEEEFVKHRRDVKNNNAVHKRKKDNDTSGQETSSVRTNKTNLESPYVKKQEDTLDEIKTILKSVLTEVKTNVHNSTKNAEAGLLTPQNSMKYSSNLLQSCNSPYNNLPNMSAVPSIVPDQFLQTYYHCHPFAYPNIPLYMQSKPLCENCLKNIPVSTNTEYNKENPNQKLNINISCKSSDSKKEKGRKEKLDINENKNTEEADEGSLNVGAMIHNMSTSCSDKVKLAKNNMTNEVSSGTDSGQNVKIISSNSNDEASDVSKEIQNHILGYVKSSSQNQKLATVKVNSNMKNSNKSLDHVKKTITEGKKGIFHKVFKIHFKKRDTNKLEQPSTSKESTTPSKNNLDQRKIERVQNILERTIRRLEMRLTKRRSMKRNQLWFTTICLHI